MLCQQDNNRNACFFAIYTHTHAHDAGLIHDALAWLEKWSALLMVAMVVKTTMSRRTVGYLSSVQYSTRWLGYTTWDMP